MDNINPKKEHDIEKKLKKDEAFSDEDVVVYSSWDEQENQAKEEKTPSEGWVITTDWEKKFSVEEKEEDIMEIAEEMSQEISSAKSKVLYQTSLSEEAIIEEIVYDQEQEQEMVSENIQKQEESIESIEYGEEIIPETKQNSAVKQQESLDSKQASTNLEEYEEYEEEMDSFEKPKEKISISVPEARQEAVSKVEKSKEKIDTRQESVSKPEEKSREKAAKKSAVKEESKPNELAVSSKIESRPPTKQIKDQDAPSLKQSDSNKERYSSVTEKQIQNIPQNLPEKEIEAKTSETKVEEPQEDFVEEKPLADFQWPGEKSVYFFYIWHCAQKDEPKENWMSGRFPFLATKMPLPPEEKLDKSFSKKDWAFKRLQYKKDIPLYFYYPEVFQPSFYDPQKIAYLRSLYFAYFPAYFREVPLPPKANKETKGPLLDPSRLKSIPFLDESSEMEHHVAWLNSKLKVLEKNPIIPKAKAENIEGIVALQQILRFYLRLYGFLLWSLNYFCNYDNHARLGFSSTGQEIFSNSFPIGLDICDFLTVRTKLPITSASPMSVGNKKLRLEEREIIPTFLGLGSFKGNSFLEMKEEGFQKQDFMIFDNCPSEGNRAEKTAENFRLFHNFFKKFLFAGIDELLASHKIRIFVRRFLNEDKVALGLKDDKLQDSSSFNTKNIYEKTIETMQPGKKMRYLKSLLPQEASQELYHAFALKTEPLPWNNVFVEESPKSWELVGYLTYNSEWNTSNISNQVLMDFFYPDAMPQKDPREFVPQGVLPFVIGGKADSSTER